MATVGFLVTDRKQQKWEHRYRQAGAELPEAAAVLAENRHLLPARGRALDLACGLGGNALLLAAAGLETEGWDYAAPAIAALETEAARVRLPLRAVVRDAVARPPEPASFDVIVVSRFLERALCPVLMQALRPGGLLFYQTFTRLKVQGLGPRNPDFLLESNELLRLFAGLRVLVYREEHDCGETSAGWRDQAMLIGQRLPSDRE
ncbi:MAG: class I SAM-dependent methyltransferase [Ectothiorhodospiraceae bacterium]|nr:class I SAM-dependent methyltransferase [Ectothiorhodospiraceae bacterium]